MLSYSKAAMERTMKIQEVLLRAMARKITWFQAAEILGFSDRHVRRIRERYEELGYDGLFDRRRGQPSRKRVPFATVEAVLGLYREKYFDLNHLRPFAQSQVEFPALFFAHARQQTEVVLGDTLLPAPGLELALCAMPIQDKVRRRRVGP